MALSSPTIHASAVLAGSKAVLIRGPSGSGKSMLAWELIQAAAQAPGLGALPFARLVADDRARLEAQSGRLLVRPAETLAGMLEIRGLGIRRLPYEPVAAVGLVVDLAAADADRLPTREAGTTSVSGVILPRLAVAADCPALLQVIAFLGTAAVGD